MAIVHPLNSAGLFAERTADSPFIIGGSYLDSHFYADELVRSGLNITFVSAHRPIQAYTEAIANAGLLIERLREPAVPDQVVREPPSRRWQRLPLFLHLRAVKR